MINSVIKLLLFQAMGEILAVALSIPVPGSVVGMLFCFFILPSEGVKMTVWQHSLHVS